MFEGQVQYVIVMQVKLTNPKDTNTFDSAASLDRSINQGLGIVKSRSSLPGILWMDMSGV